MLIEEKFSSTVIGNGCKIDNLVQIGHNCKLGMSASWLEIVVSWFGNIGNGVIIGEALPIKDHTTIGDGA